LTVWPRRKEPSPAPEDAPGTLDALYARYGGIIYARCRRLLKDPAAAEDATQETFLRVQAHLQQIREPAKIVGWLYATATHYCLNELRNQRHRPMAVESPPEIPQGVNVQEALADRDLVARIIANAPPKLRVAAWLYHVDGMDQEEVARALGVTRRSVVSYLKAFQKSAQKYLRRTALS
jgi:RNA polymerase sigma-70 factor, ECF subfamily